MSTLTNVAAIAVTAALSSMIVYFEVKSHKIRKAHRAAMSGKPEYRKLDRTEHNNAVMSVAKMSGDKNYVEAMSLMGDAVDFSKITPLCTKI